MPNRNRTPAEIAADQDFFLTSRARSPRFPVIADALEKRRQLRETIAARSLFTLFVGGLLYGIVENNYGFAVAGFGFVGFVVTSFIAGNRMYVKNGGTSNGARPF